GLVKGEYGKTPAQIDPEFRKKILGDEKPIDCRPADLIEPELEKLKAEAAKWTQQEEDVLSYAMFGQVAEKFFEKRRDKQNGIDAVHADKQNKVMPV
ncbi:MAG: oxaloacetate decarboxylase subunit alpha, partial [Ruminiclostridium sp.]|nr:oxaloacetate decarboxylase subunit alpha [Ruminiclostridium sp.]